MKFFTVNYEVCCRNVDELFLNS